MLRAVPVLALALLLSACGSDPALPFLSGDATGVGPDASSDSSLDDAGVDDDIANDDASDDTTEDATEDGSDDAGDDTTEDATDDAGDDTTEDATDDAGDDTTDAGDDTEDTTPDVSDDTTPDVRDDTTPDVSDDTTPDVSDDTTPDTSSGPPTIVTLELSRAALAEDGSVTLTAIVTDPDGADDVVAGTLSDVDAGGTLGSFERGGGAAWTTTITWAALNDLEPIAFTDDGERELQVRFFDNAGNVATQRYALPLTCDGLGACDGACTDLTTDINCGTCGTLCVGDTTCLEGACACPGGGVLCGDTCRMLGTTSDCLACDDACPGGGVCTDAGCACPDGEVVCDGVCTPLGTTSDCLACDDACPGGGVCTEAGCACPAGEEACDGVCTPLGTTSDCLACGDVCTGGRTCTPDGCACGPSQGICDGVCTFLDTELDCGDCGVVCEGDSEACVEGVCDCPDGGRYCDGVCGGVYEHTRCGDCLTCGALEACDGNRCQASLAHDLRLGPSGVLELYFAEGQWQPVCGDGFDELEATVACRQLGGELVEYSTGLSLAVDAEISVSGVACTGDEDRLTGCDSGAVGDTCAAGGVSVVCRAPAPVPADCVPLPTGSIVVNEINATGDVGAFVELRGTPGRSLDGLRVEHWRAWSGTLENDVPLSGALNGNGYAVVGGTDPAGRVGLFADPYPNYRLNGDGIRLVNCDGSVIDAVGWGSTSRSFAITGEGFSMPFFTTNSFGRLPDGTDTDVNVDDVDRLLGPSPLAPNEAYVPPLAAPRAFSGSISGSEPTFVRPATSCGSGAGTYGYDRISLFNFGASPFPIRVTARYFDEQLFVGTEEISGNLYVYVGGFDPARPTAGCVEADSGEPAIVDVTVPGREYVDIIITKRVSGDDVDEWNVSITER